jgi:ATP-dependent exoDNAse (exonuclease V) beta subunit
MADFAPTPEQQAAIETRDADVFCEAGAGTGKTRVLVDRYCEAVEHDEAGIESILAFTFTERAAAELRTRIRRELAQRATAARERGDRDLGARLARASRETERAWVMTIHGFCRRLLAMHPAAAGIDPRFRVLDETEATRMRRQARDDALAEVAGQDPASIGVIAAYRPERFGEMAVAAYERLRSQGMSEPRLPPVSEPVRSLKPESKDEPALSPTDREAALAARRTLDLVLAAFGRRYEELKTRRSGLDFGDLELRALELLRESAPVGAAWRGRFVHVMVDEFQDTNRVQLDLVEALRGPETRVFRVGDELQSIYRFRNADLAVFRAERELAHQSPEIAVRPLTGSFRSQPELVAAINVLGEAEVGADFTPLAAARDADDNAGAPRAELLLTLDEGRSGAGRNWREFEAELDLPSSERQARYVAEARVLAHRLRELVEAGEAKPGEIVVLLRAFTHVDAYEEALERAGLAPYVVGGRGYWSQQQVEDLLRLLETVANPLDDEMLLGALAAPANGASPDALWLLRRATLPETEDGERRRPPHLWPLIEWRFGAGEHRPEPLDERWLDEIPADDAGRLERFCTILARLRAAAPVLALDELVERTMTEFGYDLHLLARHRGRGRMANVRKLSRLAREFEQHEGRDLRGFLGAAQELTQRDEREGLAATQAEDHEGVRIMTVHAAKGLEFPVVAVPDLGRPLAGGEQGGDIAIGRLELDDDGEPRVRHGLRLALAAAEYVPVWELHELHGEGKAEAAEEGARLVHVAATRAEERLILSGVFKPGDVEPVEPHPRQTAIARLLPALAARGWDGEAALSELELALPAVVAGAQPLERPPTLAIRVEVPSAARAAELGARLAEVTAAGEGAAAGAQAPLARPETPLPVGHLSYSALAEYSRCAYRFYSERMLGLVEPPGPLHPEGGADAGAAADDAPALAVDARARSLGFGNAVHAALEWSLRAGWRAPDDERLLALLSGEGLGDPDHLARARALVDGWLASPLARELAAAEARAEVPFALELGGAVVRGQIDVLARATGGPAAGQLDLLGGEPAAEGPALATVVDFKTDSLGDDGPEPLRERYASQRKLYALAVAEASGTGAGGDVRAIHVFLEAPRDPVGDTFDGAALAAARRELEQQVAEIRGGGAGFEPTERPSHSVCFGCPAAERLCPVAQWKPSWR